MHLTRRDDARGEQIPREAPGQGEDRSENAEAGVHALPEHPHGVADQEAHTERHEADLIVRGHGDQGPERGADAGGPDAREEAEAEALLISDPPREGVRGSAVDRS